MSLGAPTSIHHLQLPVAAYSPSPKIVHTQPYLIALNSGLMAQGYTGATTAGQPEDNSMTHPNDPGNPRGPAKPMVAGRRLFMPKNPGAPGKLGKATTKSESLSKLRGKGALA